MSENTQKFFAEVMESSLGTFVAQSWIWNDIPSFGSLVYVENNNQINLGVISQINTGTIDSSRYPFPYKKTEEELLCEQPQIFEFLRTTFKVQIIGYIDKSSPLQTIYYQISPKPCKIHSFVGLVPKNIVLDFFSKPDFMYLLFAFEKEIPNLDELLLEILKQLADNGLLKDTYVNDFYEALSLLMDNDYKRLKLFLKRINHLFSL